MKCRVIFVSILIFMAVSFLYAEEKPDALELYRTGKYSEAVKVTQAELKEMPNRMDSYTVMGWSLIAMKKYKEALSTALKGLKRSEEHTS